MAVTSARGMRCAKAKIFSRPVNGRRRGAATVMKRGTELVFRDEFRPDIRCEGIEVLTGGVRVLRQVERREGKRHPTYGDLSGRQGQIDGLPALRLPGDDFVLIVSYESGRRYTRAILLQSYKSPGSHCSLRVIRSAMPGGTSPAS